MFHKAIWMSVSSTTLLHEIWGVIYSIKLYYTLWISYCRRYISGESFSIVLVVHSWCTQSWVGLSRITVRRPRNRGRGNGFWCASGEKETLWETETYEGVLNRIRFCHTNTVTTRPSAEQEAIASAFYEGLLFVIRMQSICRSCLGSSEVSKTAGV